MCTFDLARHEVISTFIFDLGGIWFLINSFTKGECVGSKYGRSTSQQPPLCFPPALPILPMLPVSCPFCLTSLAYLTPLFPASPFSSESSEAQLLSLDPKRHHNV